MLAGCRFAFPECQESKLFATLVAFYYILLNIVACPVPPVVKKRIMSNQIFSAAVLLALSAQAQATPIRVEFQTTVTTAIDRVTRASTPVAPISGKFAIEFDDANSVWDRDEWGPYYIFGASWITTPVTSYIPFSPYLEAAPGAQQFVYSETQGSGTWGDTGITPFKGYEVGYSDQGFGFYQSVAKVGLGPDGHESNRYTLQIGLQRILPVDAFRPLSSLEFLRSFVGEDSAGGTAVLQEGYSLQHYVDGRPFYYGGLTYLDRNLKVLSVTDLSAEVPESGTISLVLAGVIAAGAVRRRARC
jgi:hypothetical protein